MNGCLTHTVVNELLKVQLINDDNKIGTPQLNGVQCIDKFFQQQEFWDGHSEGGVENEWEIFV